jgi:hypothetical protein
VVVVDLAAPTGTVGQQRAGCLRVLAQYDVYFADAGAYDGLDGALGQRAPE